MAFTGSGGDGVGGLINILIRIELRFIESLYLEMQRRSGHELIYQASYHHITHIFEIPIKA